MQTHRCFRSLVSLAIAIVFPTALVAQVASIPPADRDALAAVVQELDAAWNARDAVRFGAVFAEEGSFQFPFEGIALRGRDAIKEFYAKQFSALPPGVRHVTKPGETDVIMPGVVAVDSEVDILAADSGAGGQPASIRQYRAFGLVVRTETGWRIRLVRLFPVVK